MSRRRQRNGREALPSRNILNGQAHVGISATKTSDKPPEEFPFCQGISADCNSQYSRFARAWRRLPEGAIERMPPPTKRARGTRKAHGPGVGGRGPKM